MNYIDKFVLADLSSISHAVMVRAQNGKVVDVIRASVSDGDNVMNVNVNIPTAYHALSAEELASVHSRHGATNCASIVGIEIAGNISRCAFRSRLTEAIHSHASATAKHARSGLVRLDAKHIAALLAGSFNARSGAKFGVVLNSLRLSLIRTQARAIVLLAALGGLAVKSLAALWTDDVVGSVLLPHRRTLARTEVTAFAVALGNARPALKLFAAHLADVVLHGRSYAVGVDCGKYNTGSIKCQ